MKKVTKITERDIDSLEFELQKEAIQENKKSHYVNNKELFKEFEKYHAIKMKKLTEFRENLLSEFGLLDEEHLKSESKKVQKDFNKAMKAFTAPPLTNKIGEAIMNISHRRCYSPRFVNYAPNWKEEMVSDAIETCVRYAHNFDPNKSNNPFAYLTQLVTNAIFQRIKKEHKQQYIKLKLFDEAHGFCGDIDDNNINSEDMELLDETNEMYQDRLEYIDNYENIQGIGNKRKRKSKKTDNSNNILDL